MSESRTTATTLDQDGLSFAHNATPAPSPAELPTTVSLPATPLQHKVVRFGRLEPGHIVLTKHGLLPLLVVVDLLACMFAAGQSLSLQVSALGLLSFLLSAQIFSPLDWSAQRGVQRFAVASLRAILEWSCVVAILAFLAIAFQQTALFPRDAIVSWFVVTPLSLLLVDGLRDVLIRAMAAAPTAAQPYIIIGANEVGVELERRITRSHASEKFCGFLDFRSIERLNAPADKLINAGCSPRDFADFVRNNGIAKVYLALPISLTPRIQELIRELRDTTASVYFVPNIFAFDLVRPRCIEINGMPAFSICDSPMHDVSSVAKRLFDLVLAGSLLLLTWPVLLAVAVAIKQSSPGPVLFKQRRYGLNGEEILVYKFRSMTVCEDGSNVMQATRDDIRVTPLGGFLRRTSLDELPQIFNVLEGKMSFVGPRPHAVAHNEAYRKLINGYMLRHKVRPGITGLAQVNGLRGETATVDKMQRRVQFDIDYMRHWSLWLDIKILARTAYTLIRDKNAY